MQNMVLHNMRSATLCGNWCNLTYLSFYFKSLNQVERQIIRVDISQRNHRRRCFGRIGSYQCGVTVTGQTRIWRKIVKKNIIQRRQPQEQTTICRKHKPQYTGHSI